MRARDRRGQAQVITLMILVSATLAVALALYAYFTGVYSTHTEQQSLYDTFASYSNYIELNVEVFLSSEEGGNYQYCILASIVNRGGDPLRVLYGLLPIIEGAEDVAISDAIAVFPVDYSTLTRQVYSWIANDTDRDGIVELYGWNGVSYLAVYDTVTGCPDLYTDYLIGNLNDLPLARESDDPSFGVYDSRIYLDPQGPSFLELVRAKVGGVLPDDAATPLWNATVPAGGKIQVYIFANSPVPLDKLSLVGAFYYPGDDNVYIFMVQPVASTIQAP